MKQNKGHTQKKKKKKNIKKQEKEKTKLGEMENKETFIFEK
jgi:hypothetical protein